ncbi:MAG: vitamin B12-dependent ribonucleotide reductase, partial [Candidatus Thalassarchaeaceae archaeon]|nr:vitamin B12-dependent ribonucleotide reductase [Candidatus Thalassarchaeaceae archaeon]
TQKFDIDGFRHSCRLWTSTLEISVLMAQFPSQAISRKSYDYRTLGLGFCNIGSMLMHMGIPYNDSRGYAICGAISAIMTGEAYATSADMASFLGPFPEYEANSEHMLKVMRNHRRAAYNKPADEYEGVSIAPMGIDSKKCPKDLLDAARSVWDQALEMGKEHGYRNAQTTVIAPTGTIGLVMAADTTGVEPQFSLVQYKTLAGGGSLRIINRGVPSALKRLGYNEGQVQEIVEHVMGAGSLERCESVPMQSLLEMGFSDTEFSKIEGAVENVFDIRSLFAPHVLGHEFCTGTLKIPSEECDGPFFDTLGFLGFSSSEIEDAHNHIYGHLSIEDAPHLKEEHLAVFDCATPGGKNGTRCIDWDAHVLMMAAAQPFISGAISKTINMPSDASIEDVRAAYDLSHSTMNKACAVYRDGSKLSQPLMNSLVDISSAEEEEEEEVVTVKKAVKQVAEALPLPKEKAAPIAESFVQNYIATRKPLPDVRDSRTMKASVGGHTVYLASSKYDDGRLGEIMITTSKEGAAWRSLLNQFAIAVSIGLQYGVPLDAFVKSFTFQKFEPSGMVQGGSNRVKMATSLVDYIFRELAIDYLGRNDLAHVSEEDLEVTSISRPEITEDGVARTQSGSRNVQTTLDVDPESAMRQQAREAGFTGDICTDCGGSQMVRNGTCLKCNSCGATTGCS